jgi:2-keto-4-pentenoate hydratase/2-oxohepta-3-ene-1,7-dioic acid hydratase in catechol pathway
LRLASFRHGGKNSFGIVTDRGVINLGGRDGLPGDLAAALAAEGIDAIARHAAAVPDHALGDIDFLPVIPRPEKLICVGLNYRDHAAEVGAEIPKYPTLFVRFPDSQVGHGGALVRPKASTRFDYEGELAVIIGKSGRHIGRDNAFDHVAGYSCFNDGTIRDWQGHTTQFTAGKNFVATGAMGPWMVTADEIPDPGHLAVRTRLNGETVQDGSTADMVFDIPALIEYVSTFTELRPGDVIATGTPAGVGYRRSPRLYMKAGDIVEVEIEGIGVLRNSVIDER